MPGKVYFRADADRSIGYGHFIRSLALASYLKDRFDCTVFAKSPDAFQIKMSEGICPLAGLPDDESRFSTFLQMLDGSETVVLDNYFYSEDYIAKIRALGCKTVRIQDFFGRKSYADASVFPCRNPRWALLRPAFLKDIPEERTKGRVTVSFGGADPLGLTDRFCGILSDMRFDPVTFKGAGAEEIAGVMRSSEAVVCSASSVCYEALACGCKVFAGWYVDNQRDFYEELVQRGLIHPLGDLRLLHTLPDLSSASGPDVREEFRVAGVNYVNLFKSLELDMKDYRELSGEESRKVWEVRTLPEICRCMTNPEPFSFESHLAFTESLKSREDRFYCAFFRNGEFVGSYDLVGIEGPRAERGLFVNPEWQGKGIARMMEARIDCLAAEMGLRELSAGVLNDNPRSLAYHRSAGYRQCGTDDRFTYFQKTL